MKKEQWAVIALIALSHPAEAAEWSATSIQLLMGNDYILGDAKRSIVTVEHANGWKYGDNYFFLDVAEPFDRGTGLYAEYAPRLSLGKITGGKLTFGPVADVLLAGMFEYGGDLHPYLIGAGIDLRLPGLDLAEVDVYFRDDPNIEGATHQLTAVWLANFTVRGLELQFTGFVDWAGAEGPRAANLLTQPKLLVDVGGLWGAAGSLYAGVEYQVWFDKFGIAGEDEFVPQPMVKWVF